MIHVFDPCDVGVRLDSLEDRSDVTLHRHKTHAPDDGCDLAVLCGPVRDSELEQAASMVDGRGGRIVLSVPDGGRSKFRSAQRAVDVVDQGLAFGRFEQLDVDDGQVTAVLVPCRRREHVVIWTGNAIGPWHPSDIVTRGLGGSETAAWRLAENLANLDYKVTLYGQFDEYGLYRDVLLRHYDAFDPTRDVDVFVGFRNAMIFQSRVKARRRIMWLEDLPGQEMYDAENSQLIDRVVCVSDWHRKAFVEHYPWAPAERVVASRNGIHLPWFDGAGPERENRVLFTSSPDRGLDVLLELWPEVRERVPDAELVSTYSRWYDIVADAYPKAYEHRQKLIALLDQPGVKRLEGGMGQRDLAHLMRTAKVWAHPSWYTDGNMEFHETSCISAMEAQAAGLVVVASNWGALTETVQVGTLVDGDPREKDGLWRKTFVDSIVRGLTDEKMQDTARELGPELVRNMGWLPVAEHLTVLFEDDQ